MLVPILVGGIVLLLLLLSRLRLSLMGEYQEGEGSVALRIGILSIPLYPPPVRTKRKSKKRISQSKKPSKESKESKEKPSRKELWEKGKALFPLVRPILERFQKKLRIDRLELHLMIGGEDPADAAIYYGYANAIVGFLLPWLEAYFTVRKKDIQIGLDFALEKPKVAGRFSCSLTVGQLVAIGCLIVSQYFALSRKQARQNKTEKVVESNGKE